MTDPAQVRTDEVKEAAARARAGEAAGGQPDTVRVAVEVFAGVVPGQPEPEWTRRWFITDRQWQEARGGPAGQGALLASRNGEAQGYAGFLMMQPDLVNWVRVDWVWM